MWDNSKVACPNHLRILLDMVLMNGSNSFQIEKGQAIFRLVGRMSLEESAAACVDAIRLAAKQGITELLVNLTRATDLGPISTLDRFWLAKQFASAAIPGFKLAVVANRDMIDQQHFGVMVARNRGLQANVFTTEQEAQVWLRSYQPI
jgi:hypothetical protein